ncbi:hypothetical protein [Sphaerospermopsis sp. LEGE 08334]|jgi:hypothetical protein|uniref:hypothetical protein n=1 Tax=Sphaerospermopsis sp. LEGE 08334 TaxID=1828651 RepID=UPI001881F499|nr:hypothetical protein [Sphaerospermopsis sp. LEGE 08334]MBE9056314.1 hypothetical protein [Sphaerospermopsis sp. LEGE 08334]
MQSMTIKTHVGCDGMLQISLPEVQDTDVEVIIVYQPIQKTEKPSLASLYGICADDPIIIDDDSVFDNLDEKIEGVFDS